MESVTVKPAVTGQHRKCVIIDDRAGRRGSGWGPVHMARIVVKIK